MPLLRWVMSSHFTPVPSRGLFRWSFSCVWELAQVSFPSLPLARTVKNPPDTVGFRQRTTSSILWVILQHRAQFTWKSFQVSHVTRTEQRNPGLTLLATLAKVHWVVLTQVVTPHMATPHTATEVALITIAEYVHPF